MIDALKVALWISLGLLFHTYAGYPLLAFLLSRVRRRTVRQGDDTPDVSLIIAAYNEERVIGDKLENSLALAYPAERLQILVAADGSDDRTVAIAETYRQRGVTVLHHPERRGKSAAISRAVQQARGEILLFADANTVYSRDLVRKIVRNFADPEVGGVSGRKILIEDHEREATAGETAYWGYEAALKTWETRLGSIVTADGEVFALRKSLFEAIPPRVVHDDMYLTLRLVQRGFRVVYENEATSAERASRSIRDEFQLKVRYASAGFQIVRLFRGLLFAPSLFAFQFASHKILRWLAPFFLLACLVLSAAIPQWPYRLLLLAQVAFYGVALAGAALHRHLRLPLIYLPFYFCMGNLAAFYGSLRHLRTGQSQLWHKAER
jgi:cellulose synthase/poly-beta-1,6-N-acetylglucosamine synthase-like glycosyltransferase